MIDKIEYSENKLLNDYYDKQDREENDNNENERLDYLDHKAVERMLDENY